MPRVLPCATSLTPRGGGCAGNPKHEIADWRQRLLAAWSYGAVIYPG